MPIYSLKSRTLRAKQTNSLNLSTVITTSPRSPSPFCLCFWNSHKGGDPYC